MSVVGVGSVMDAVLECVEELMAGRGLPLRVADVARCARGRARHDGGIYRALRSLWRRGVLEMRRDHKDPRAPLVIVGVRDEGKDPDPDVEVVLVEAPSPEELERRVLDVLEPGECLRTDDMRRRIEEGSGVIVGEEKLRRILRDMARRGLVRLAGKCWRAVG